MTFIEKSDIVSLEVVKEYLKSINIDIFSLPEIEITTDYSNSIFVECIWIQIDDLEFYILEESAYNEAKGYVLNESLGSGTWGYNEIAIIASRGQRFVVFSDKQED